MYGMAAAQFTRGYLGQEEVERQRAAQEAEAAARGEQREFERGMAGREMELREEQAAGDAELRKAKMDEIKRTAKKENFKETLQHFLVGDFRGGEAAYNKTGRKMQEGSAQLIQDDEGNQMIKWIDEESGEPVVVDPRFAMLITGLKPKDLETAEEAHKRKVELEGMKAKTTGKRPAQLQIYDHILNNLKKEDGTKYSPEEAWQKAMEGKTTATREVARMAASLTRDGMDPEEATAKASEMWDAIVAAYGSGSGKPTPAPEPGAAGDETARYLQGAKTPGAMAGPHEDEDEELAM